MTGDRRQEKSSRRRKKERHAVMHNAARAVQCILHEAASGVTEAYGPTIRLLQTTHDVMPPANNEGRGPSGPIARLHQADVERRRRACLGCDASR